MNPGSIPAQAVLNESLSQALPRTQKKQPQNSLFGFIYPVDNSKLSLRVNIVMVARQSKVGSFLAYRGTFWKVKNTSFKVVEESFKHISGSFLADMPGQIVEAVMKLVLERQGVFNLIYR
jgi:hypothetical protein